MVAAALMFEVASRYCALLTSATPNPPDVLFTLHYGKLHGIDLNSTSGGCIPSACKTPEEAFEAINRALDLVNAVVNKTLTNASVPPQVTSEILAVAKQVENESVSKYITGVIL